MSSFAQDDESRPNEVVVLADALRLGEVSEHGDVALSSADGVLTGGAHGAADPQDAGRENVGRAGGVHTAGCASLGRVSGETPRAR